DLSWRGLQVPARSRRLLRQAEPLARQLQLLRRPHLLLGRLSRLLHVRHEPIHVGAVEEDEGQLGRMGGSKREAVLDECLAAILRSQQLERSSSLPLWCCIERCRAGGAMKLATGILSGVV